MTKKFLLLRPIQYLFLSIFLLIAAPVTASTDPSISPQKSPEPVGDYFPHDYEQGRRNFRRQTAQWPEAITGNFRVPSKIDDDLTIDYFYLPPTKKKEKLFILTSGIHGVEAFVGSALQRYFLTEVLTGAGVLPDEARPDADALPDAKSQPRFDRSRTGVLLIHAMNPYGFKYLRRVTENNVDLNRNMDVSDELYASKNPGYEKVEQMLNPRKPVDLSSFGYYFSFVEMIYKIARYSMKPLRQAVLQGQYEFPKGLYFGGDKPEPQKAFIEKLVRETSGECSQILAIDLHTGYGENGKLHLFGDSGRTEREKELSNKVFGDMKIDTGDDKDFYSIKGDFSVFLGKVITNENSNAGSNSGDGSNGKVFIPMTFEFGTLDSQTTFGALKSIDNMIRENQGFHYGYKTPEDKETVRRRIQEMYYPADREWREKVLAQTRDILPRVLSHFQQL